MPDPVKRVKKFADEYDLGFALLADEDRAMAEAYRVWRLLDVPAHHVTAPTAGALP